MAYRIEVSYRNNIKDVPAQKLKKRIKTDFGIDIEETHVVDVYTVDTELDQRTLGILQSDAFVDPVIQKSITDGCTLFDAAWVIEVGFKPGVTDNTGRTAKEVIEAISGIPFNDGEAVYTSRVYFLKGSLSEKDIVRITEGALANTLINRYSYKRIDQYKQDAGMGTSVPRVTIAAEPVVEDFDFTIDMDELVKINRKRTWALSREELAAIRAYFANPTVIEERKKSGLDVRPTDVEIEAIAQTWSEHCKHKIFNASIDYEEDGKISKIDSLFKT
ncbi:MAG: phosphoribosylformylglycinamidine synthase, partial [Syntrophus sp. (in: bacteria)]|nr:phosphoribosylformylglycinamidine synthase [Syntrophus sp. (in: bacteria)]